MPHNILVVDDEPPIAEMVAVLLEDEGYAVTCAHDGQAALAEIERDPPTLVVTDVMMPRLDGVSLTNRLRERGDRTPVVLMSAVSTAVDLPGVEFVPKPFDIEHIVKVVNRVIKHAAEGALQDRTRAGWVVPARGALPRP